MALDSSISEAITQLQESMYLQTRRGNSVVFDRIATYACGLLMCTQQGVGNAVFGFQMSDSTMTVSPIYAPANVGFSASYDRNTQKLTLTSSNIYSMQITIVYTNHP